MRRLLKSKLQKNTEKKRWRASWLLVHVINERLLFWLAHNAYTQCCIASLIEHKRTRRTAPHNTFSLTSFFFDIKIKDNCLTRKKSNLFKDSYLLTMKNITQIILRFQNENIVFILDLI